MSFDPAQFLGIPSDGPDRADALLFPLPLEKTVSYGRGASGGPRAILEASLQIETFDEETLVDFAEGPKLHMLPPLVTDGGIEDCLRAIENHVRTLRSRWPGKFFVSLGGEHAMTYATVLGLFDLPERATLVQIDAHADLIDVLHGRRWSHGTVMRRLWERGCRLVQIGIRSLSREEYNLATAGPRIVTYYAHRLADQWADLLKTLRDLEGDVYLTIDVDGLDASVIPSTGTPQPGGLSWRQTMDILRTIMVESRCRLAGADVVEFVPSPVPPGCDPTAARLTAKLLAWWWKGKRG
jgi:agmatinase